MKDLFEELASRHRHTLPPRTARSSSLPAAGTMQSRSHFHLEHEATLLSSVHDPDDSGEDTATFSQNSSHTCVEPVKSD